MCYRSRVWLFIIKWDSPFIEWKYHPFVQANKFKRLIAYHNEHTKTISAFVQYTAQYREEFFKDIGGIEYCQPTTWWQCKRGEDIKWTSTLLVDTDGRAEYCYKPGDRSSTTVELPSDHQAKGIDAVQDMSSKYSTLEQTRKQMEADIEQFDAFTKRWSDWLHGYKQGCII